MKHLIFVFLLLALAISNVSAQSGFRETVTQSKRSQSQILGRDFWFAPIQNDPDTTQKLIRLFIASPNDATVYIEVGTLHDSLQLRANWTATYNLPLWTELKSSGISEKKAIHVYCTFHSIAVTAFSTVAFSGERTIASISGDAFLPIPTQGLGTDYVIAACPAPSGVNAGDNPSEFTISAPYDSTAIDITPTADLRLSSSYPDNDVAAVFPAGKQFRIVLNKGEAIQYQTNVPNTAKLVDVSGTSVYSNKPIAIVAGAMNTQFWDHNYADNVSEIVPSFPMWGKTYYSTPISGGWDTYTLISSKPNQTIYRTTCTSPLRDTFVIPTKNGVFHVQEQDGSKWTSDAPFLLSQFANSDGKYGSQLYTNPFAYTSGLILTPEESFTDSVTVAAPLSDSLVACASLASFIAHPTSVTTDPPQSLKTWQCSTGPYEAASSSSNYWSKLQRMSSVFPFDVFVTGSSGPSRFSFSYPAFTNVVAIGLTDSLSPTPQFESNDICIHATLVDSTSGIATIELDSISNFTFALDPSFEIGTNMKASFVDFCAIDSLKTGYASFHAYDMAGNRTQISISYIKPTFSSRGFFAETKNFDTVLVGTQKTLPRLTITDTSTVYPITINNVWTNNEAFIFDGSRSENKLPITLTPGISHTFSISFHPTEARTYVGAISIADGGDVPAQSVSISGIGYTQGSNAVNTLGSGFYCNISPNPAGEMVTAQFGLTQQAVTSFSLYDLLGNTVYSWRGEEEAGDHLQQFDLGHLKRGTYFWRFESGSQTASGKLVLDK